MTYRLFAAGSFFIFFAFVACGISFFSPWWMENTPVARVNYTQYLANYTIDNKSVSYSYGLWAVCSDVCQWFWEDGFRLQRNLFTPLKWHLASQVLYFIAFVVLLMAEFYSKISLCTRERKAHYRVLWISLLFSAILQLCALAVFGSGSWQDYGAKTNSMPYHEWINTSTVFLGWSYWMCIPAIFFTILASLIFIIADLWTFRDKI